MEYTKLDVWTEARKLANSVYDVSRQFPKNEIFGLTSQMRRCSISIPSNVAEGCGRQTSKETIRFLYISRGSLYELETQCYLALDQNYVNETQFNSLFELIQSCKRLLNGFINYYKKL
ncbi:MAG TPA: four helix bundle protein [Flavobacterium sp.]|nr:four helix bundle protein [Flavobacterium sp.]